VLRTASTRGFNFRALLVLVAAAGAACDRDPAPQRAEGPAAGQSNEWIAIANVTVVDVASGAQAAGMTVVTKGDQIAQVGRGIAVPQGAIAVDGGGKFLIPGLWDMHAHHQGTGAESLDLFVAQGVLGTRDMGADVEFILPLRDRVKRGELLGPEIVAAGPILDDRPPDWPFRRHITNAEEARTAVRELKARGVDLIKVHDGTPRDAFFAIANEAAKLGLPFAGHVPAAVTIEEAADSGITSIEHLANFRLFYQCSPSEPHTTVPCRVLFDTLAARRVWQTPTMAFARELPEVFAGQPLRNAEYASDSLLDVTRRNAEASKLDERALSSLRAGAQSSVAAVREMLTRGVGFLAGCDALVPGFCLHDELERMTEAGFTSLQAIQAATINPAKALGRESTLGTIDVGKRADLVLLDGDPLADIRNTRRIAAVVVRGRLLSKLDIDQIIAAHRRMRRAP
jgi:imidazolonepropionase-like amidohydrolase